MSVAPEKVTQLKNFVTLCKANPAILHHPDLTFFKDWLESLGGKVPDPPKQEAPKPEPPKAEPKSEPKVEPVPDDEPTPTPEGMDDAVPKEDEESDLEIDMEGTVPPDDDPPQEMGDPDIEVTDEMMEEASGRRGQAQMAFSDGNFEEAVELFTAAIKLNPHSAPLFAKRASAYVKLQKPNAALRDVDKAIQINPDSALAYKWKGRANSLLGNWEEGYKAYQTASKLDYDDSVIEWMKEIKPKAQKIIDHKMKKERRAREKEIEAKKERIRQAKEARERAAKEREKRESEGEMPGGEMPGGGMPGGGMPGGGMPSGMAGLLNDPELMQLFSDPEVSQAFMDIQSNPMNIAKHQNNPKVMAAIQKLQQKLAGSGMGPGMGPGMGGGMGPGMFPGMGPGM